MTVALRMMADNPVFSLFLIQIHFYLGKNKANRYLIFFKK
jgi:hypothetical protein